MKKRTIATFLALTMAVSLFAGCGQEAAPAASGDAPESQAEAAPEGETYKLLFGHTLTEQDPFHQAYLNWAEGVKEASDGRLIIEVYPNSQLGVEEDVLEQMKQGTNVGWQTDAARLGNYVNEFSVLLAPYFLESLDEVKQLMDSPTIGAWEDELAEKHNIKVLSFAYVQGYRNVFSNKKATNPAEMKGMQIRTAGAPIWVSGVGSLGCTPVSLPYGETYNGIQTKVVDGCELPYIAANNLKIQEVAKYALETQHFYQNNFIVCSVEWFNSLPEDLQKILIDECDKAGLAISEQMEKDTAAAKQEMVDAGVEVVPYEEMDIDAFKAASEKAYEELDLLDARDAIFAELGR